MKMILFNQNPMIEKLLESVSKKLELSIENFNHYQELSARLKEDPEWLLIADDECLEKLDQVDWLELKETISQNKNSVCMYKKGNEAQPFLEGFEMKIKKPFLPTEMLKVLQKKLGSNMGELEPSQNSDPTQEILETNWDELENLGDLEALAKEEPNNEEQLLPTLNEQEGETPKEEAQEEVKKEEVKEMQEEIKEKEKEKQEVAENPQDEEKPKDDETRGSVETPKDEEVSKELETQEEVETPKEEVQEQEPIKEETQEIKEEKQEKTQDSPSTQELEAMQELVKEIQENSNDQENKKETQENQENTETPQDTETQELEIPKEEETQEVAEKTQAQGLEKEEIAETPQELEVQETQDETPQELEVQDEKLQENETPKDENMQESTQNLQELETQEAQDETPQEDHYESIEDIPEPVMAKAMGEELPFLNEAVAKTPNNENDTETPKESVAKTPNNENDTETPQEKEESAKTSKESNEIPSPLELRLNLQDLLKSLNQESFKSLLENKTLSIKITLEDKKPNE
ncbi:chemotaxis regulatory protein ChePep [Helicobacter pylori]|uniref:Poly E-rich protein n=1 Tax=Helicobacter pylori Hp P-2 TaxID=992073 RepID=J0PM92_HELPX|nr:chemotaxis regulatory protein ChePep [Helicobacter pylori]EJB99722.1 poly E-rich protein [Helicobacter pylori Hp P-2]EJC57654.1 poly E-rich protein [Helicobacter pylori Hp P-2b]